MPEGIDWAALIKNAMDVYNVEIAGVIIVHVQQGTSLHMPGPSKHRPWGWGADCVVVDIAQVRLLLLLVLGTCKPGPCLGVRGGADCMRGGGYGLP